MARAKITTEPGEADFVVCMRYTAPEQLILPDNALGACAHCNHAIQFRPDLPASPTKICWLCSIELARATSH
jgi:hypothetical protein